MRRGVVVGASHSYGVHAAVVEQLPREIESVEMIFDNGPAVPAVGGAAEELHGVVHDSATPIAQNISTAMVAASSRTTSG